jgi:hypothetical protein
VIVDRSQESPHSWLASDYALGRSSQLFKKVTILSLARLGCEDCPLRAPTIGRFTLTGSRVNARDSEGLADLWRSSQLLEETEHFCSCGQEEVAKIVQCGEHSSFNRRVGGGVTSAVLLHHRTFDSLSEWHF